MKPCIPERIEKQKEVNVPFFEVFKKHSKMLVLGTIAAICTFVVFYLTTVFALQWGTKQLGYTREEFLQLQLVATLCFAAFIPLSAVLAENSVVRQLQSRYVWSLLFSVSSLPICLNQAVRWWCSSSYVSA